ncbi:hypothetical protein BASA81_003310 [Batrachochytrium salamandrivorans]|nr:hypothetical protein BASA81_003310 [Batrachochytrium salamandrivorans]
MNEVLAKEVEHVLRLGEEEAPELQTCLAVVIQDKKSLSSILKLLSNAALPLHWKRLRHSKLVSHVLVCSQEEEEKISIFKLELCQVQVPKPAPLTESQVRLWSERYWPVQFSSKQCAAPTLVPRFSLEEIQTLTEWMRLACQFPVQIVDPRTNQCLAKIGNKVKSIGIAHLIMLALDASAKVVQRSTNPEDYLCTGMDVFLLHEPCIMCSMALLHSRVGRVFFHYSNPTSGALDSVCRLHTLESINHRYRVFKQFFNNTVVSGGEETGRCF